MKMFFSISAVIAFLCLCVGTASAHQTGSGHVHYAAPTVQAFMNTDCVKNNTCDLKRFSLTVRAIEVWFADSQDITYGTTAIAEYETSSVGELEKYVIVQFMKGCAFSFSRDADGNIKKYLGTHFKEYFGESGRNYSFADWVIDSADKDPAYKSDSKLGRYYFYKWNKIPNSYGNQSEVLYGEAKPREPKLYVTDTSLPGAFLLETGGNNVSLELKTCIYKTADVPQKTEPENVNFATPIRCFNWKNSYIYNFDLKKFEAKEAIDPFCLEPHDKYFNEQKPR